MSHSTLNENRPQALSARLSGLFIYPVKSCRGVPCQTAEVGPRGLEGDRRWMLVEADGQAVTQRSDPVLARVEPEIIPGGIKLSLPGLGHIEVPEPGADAPAVDVTVWSSHLKLPVAVEADGWCGRVLGRAARLVWQPPGVIRAITKGSAQPGDEVSLADAFPCLLTSENALADLNKRIVEGVAGSKGEPVAMSRFRPNLVVSGVEAFEEDHWALIEVGHVGFEVTEGCQRCRVTTVDQATGEVAGREPLRTLATFRRRGDHVWFGVNLIQRGAGPISVGDEIRVLSEGELGPA